MHNSIIQQCKKLYMEAFGDDEQFTDLLFDLFFDTSCRYICCDGKIVSMLFAIDISLDGYRGKYIYAVATHPDFRGKGYMSRLFDEVSAEFKEQYEFLCLKPMSEGLFDFYSRLGFIRQFKKSIIENSDFSDSQLKDLNDINDIKNVRKALLIKNYAEYCDDFYKLMLSYCNVSVDSLENPKLFVVFEKQSGKIKEVLGEYNLLPNCYNSTPILIPGDGYDFAMIKNLNEKTFDDGYLGFALD